jgi:hypothetical protein
MWVHPAWNRATRLVGGCSVPGGTCLAVFDTGTGAFLRGLPRDEAVRSLIVYRRPSGGRPRIAAVSDTGLLCIYDGANISVCQLIAYEDPTSGRTRLITG